MNMCIKQRVHACCRALPILTAFTYSRSRARLCLKRDRPAFAETPRLIARGNSSLPGRGELLILPARSEGDMDMLGLIALVLIVLWLLGFLAFHVSASMVHLLLVVGLVLLILHFVRGGTRTA